MALSYTGGRNLYATLTDNDATTNLTFGDILINSAIRKYCNSNGGKWPFLEKVTTQPTVAAQQAYTLPQSTRKIVDLYVTVGSTIYKPVAVESSELWARVLEAQLGTSDRAQFYYRQGNTVLIAPTPASTAGTITIRTRKQVVDLRNADYTTGTASITNGAYAVAGAGTTFTAAMVGRFINFTSGDGNWYEIGAYTSATAITLVAPYEGTTLAGSAFTIGEFSPLPIGYHEMPVFDAASLYWAKEKDQIRSKLYKDEANRMFADMIEEAGEKIEGAYMPPSETFRDPNVPEPVIGASSFT